MLAYWQSRYGRKLPIALKRGIADAFTRLCTERAAIKYDGSRGKWRLGDVIEVVHPKPKAPWQAELFTWLLDRRRHPDAIRADLSKLQTIDVFEELRTVPASEQRELLVADPDYLRRAGVTWEYLSGLGGEMDARAWEAIIPSMGYMALLRNLRNFEQAGISEDAALVVVGKLMDAGEVARSRQFPYRFLSAYKNVVTDRFSYALEVALQHSISNLPQLPGRTLLLVDTSDSMKDTVSEKSVIRRIDVSALFAFAAATRNNGRVDLVGWADGQFVFGLQPGISVLKGVTQFDQLCGTVGHGTRMLDAIATMFDPKRHDRIMIFTDMQTAPYLRGGMTSDWSGGRYVQRRLPSIDQLVPNTVPIIGVNAAGYAATVIDPSTPNRLEIGGFSDKLFTLAGAFTAGKEVTWPF